MTAPRTDYDGRMARVYQAGRALPSSTVDHWVSRARQHLPTGATTVLDLGAGTGRFSEALAEGLSLTVVAMEPASGMRAQALTSLTSRRVHLVAGAAQALPLVSRSVDLVWASQVLHHVSDLDRSASEIRRILRPEGRLLVRATLDSAEWILAPFFPVMRHVASDLPQLHDYIGAFRNAGLQLLVHEQVQQVVASDGWSLIERTSLRADSVLARLDDKDFSAGMRALRRAVEDEAIQSPIAEKVDLLVFTAA